MARTKVDPESTDLPPADRLPTADETNAFDCYAGWDLLSPAQQREVGALAMKLAVYGRRMLYPCDAPAWTDDRRGTIDRAYDDTAHALGDEVEQHWPRLFGWVRQQWSKPIIREVA